MNLELLVEDYGLEYILYALDIEPAYVIEVLMERGMVTEEDLSELFEQGGDYEDDLWD